MARERTGLPVWVIVGLAMAGAVALIVAGVVAFVLFRGLARPPGPPKAFVRPGFTFDYPSNWKLDEKDEDYDPDRMFSIDASSGAMILFVIVDGELDAAKTLATNVQAQSKQLSNPSRTEFQRWGKYDGRGAVLRGTAVGLVRATVRVFVFNAGGRTFTVTEFCPDDEKVQHAPGYQLIEGSFRVLN